MHLETNRLVDSEKDNEWTESSSIWQEIVTRQMYRMDDMITRSDMRDLQHDF